VSRKYQTSHTWLATWGTLRGLMRKPVEHIRFGPRNLDYASPSNLTLDALTSDDIRRYRSGDWLGNAVTSAELRRSPRDPDGVAELAARARVWVERHEGRG